MPKLDKILEVIDNATIFQLDASKNVLKGKTQIKVCLLADYDVELIVDSSLSMRKADCDKLSPYVPRGLTITAFNGSYNVYRNATPSNIADLFNNPNFRGGTRLAEPLANRLNEFFTRRKSGSKPLLIAVITDGVPHPQEQPVMVASTLVNASKHMKNASEVTVVFFQIGSRAKFGRAFLDYLDNQLVSNGARHDFVKTVSFDHLVQVGLSNALVESIEQFAKSRAEAPLK